MTLLDQIVNEVPVTVPGNAQDMIERSAAMLPPVARREAFRGLITPVEGQDTILDKAKLNWKSVPMPMATQSPVTGKVVVIPGMKNLHRSDNGDYLGSATDKYIPVQNSVMIDQFREAAEMGRLKITHAGALNGGKTVMVSAKSTENARVEFRSAGGTGDYTQRAANRGAAGFATGDILELKFTMTNGHTPGSAFRMRAYAERVACLNGATLVSDEIVFSMSHRTHFGHDHAATIQRLVAESTKHFKGYAAKASQLAQTPAPRKLQIAYLAELVQPELIKAAAERLMLPGRFATATVETIGKFVIDELITRETRLFDPKDFGRTTNRLIETLDTQEGGDLSQGTMWHAYNAVTNYVDHHQGRQPDSGLRSALFGEGDKLKTRALALAVNYSERVR